MLRRWVIVCSAVAGLLVPAAFSVAQAAPAPTKLAVPYVSEVPDGKWFGSWKNACEEASLNMVHGYYAGEERVSVKSAKAFMQNIFNVERRLWGSDANTDVAQTIKLIAGYSDFNGRAVLSPSVADIKSELDAGRPVIAPINGFTLGNKEIPFLPSGSAYHMFVIVGYDEATNNFIVNDTGDLIDGPGHLYGYDLIMRSLHDYNQATKKTNGPARAIFTYPKLVKTANSHRIYYLSGATKQYVSHPLVFLQRGWSTSWVQTVSADWLAQFAEGAVLDPKH